MGIRDSFLFNKLFLKNLAIAGVVGVVGLMLIFVWLGIYTNHGEALSLPNFEGLDIRQAREIAEEKGLKLEIIDSVYTAPGRRGSVIDQTPPKDFKVKEGRTIFVTIISFFPEMTTLPKLSGLSMVQARADILTNGLRIGRISYEPWKYDNLVKKVVFNGELIKEGDPIAKGSVLDLVLGETDNLENSLCPDLFGLTQNEASFRAAEKMLNIGVEVYDKTVKNFMDSVNARVIKQRPNDGVSMKPGDEIDIWLSLKVDTTYIEDDDSESP